MSAQGPLRLQAIILAYNEEKHLARCLRSLEGVCDGVLVVDSGSDDRTQDIARSHGASLEVHPFLNYATQFNWAIGRLGSSTGWLLRIDADEVLDPGSAARLRPFLAGLDQGTAGVLVRRRMHFLGRRMAWGGMDPVWQLRLWRAGRGRCEARWMDEHMVVEGRVVASPLAIDDINLNSLTWWTDKHNRYASREAIDVLNARHRFLPNHGSKITARRDQVAVKRWLKHDVYLRLPPSLRAIAYFLYRYGLRLGFLDGREGLYFHLLQGLWYRLLVDAKVLEIERTARKGKMSIADAIRQCTGIDPRATPMDAAGPPPGASEGPSAPAGGGAPAGPSLERTSLRGP